MTSPYRPIPKEYQRTGIETKPFKSDEQRKIFEREMRARSREAQKMEKPVQDQYGYVSPFLQRLRESGRDPALLHSIEDKRKQPHENVRVEIPDLVQPSGLPQLAKRNNNPGNLKMSSERDGMIGDKGFVKYPTPEEGLRNVEMQIRTDQFRGLTLEEFVYKYAPPIENDTEKYLDQLSRKLDATRNIPLKYIDPRQLSDLIVHKESNTKVIRDGSTR